MIPSESFKTSDPPLTLFNKIVTPPPPRTKVLQKIAPGLDKDSLCEKGHIQKEIVLNLKQREKKWAELLVSQSDTSQLSSDAKDYLAGLLGKEGSN